VHRTRNLGFFSIAVVNVSITASAPQKGQLFRLSIVLSFLSLPDFVRCYQFRVNPFQVVVVPIYPSAYILPRIEQPGD
jgi:hypothetical protein